jgi:hypothetical protein
MIGHTEDRKWFWFSITSDFDEHGRLQYEFYCFDTRIERGWCKEIELSDRFDLAVAAAKEWLQ